MSENGLGLLSWTTKASENVGVGLGLYMYSILVNRAFISSISRLWEFIKLGDRRGNRWMWCRLFDESALFHLSTRKIGMQQYYQPSTISLGSSGRCIRKYEGIAMEVVNYFSGNTGVVVGSVAAQTIMTNAVRRPQPTHQRLVVRAVEPENQSENDQDSDSDYLFDSKI